MDDAAKTRGDPYLDGFARHCRAFYDAGLHVPRPGSDASLPSLCEEKKSEEDGPVGGDGVDRQADGRLVLESLDIVGALCHATARPPTTVDGGGAAGEESVAARLRRDHARIARRHGRLLAECGLADVDRFLRPPAAGAGQAEAEGGARPGPGGDERPGGRGDPGDLLQEYVRTRDAVRRRAHAAAMRRRRDAFVRRLRDAVAAEGADRAATSSAASAPRLTRADGVDGARSAVRAFVEQYGQSVASHSFLAGLRRLAERQLGGGPAAGAAGGSSGRASPRVARWTFEAAALTEAGDDAYARDAVRVLLSFLVLVEDDGDLEGGTAATTAPGDDRAAARPADLSAEEGAECALSFEVDKDLSDRNLRRLLAALPHPRRLDARATGTVVEADPRDCVPRRNAAGRDDERRPWFAGLETCHLL